MDIQIKEAEQSLLLKWNNILEETKEGSIFHKLEWLKITEKYTCNKLYPMIIYNEEEIMGIFPIFLQKRLHSIIKMLVSPPGNSLIPYLGPLFPHYNEYKQDKKESLLSSFQENLTHFFQRIDADYINILFTPGFQDMRSFEWNGYDIKPRYTYIQSIVEFDEIWNGFKKELRKNINSTEKKGVIVYEGKREDIEFIYSSVFLRLSEQEQSLKMPKQYFYELYDAFYPKNMRIFITEYNNEKVGGVIVTCHNRRVSVWFGAVQSKISGIYPNDLLHWYVMKWANEQGQKEFEIIGANYPTISFYKSRFNLSLQLFFSVTRSSRVLESARICRNIIKKLY